MCRSEGFELVSVRNAYENELIKSFVLREHPTSEPQASPWMGLHHDSTTAWTEPKWSDESSVRFTNWARNELSDQYQACKNIIKAL